MNIQLTSPVYDLNQKLLSLSLSLLAAAASNTRFRHRRS